jgi:hypothetical protein
MVSELVMLVSSGRAQNSWVACHIQGRRVNWACRLLMLVSCLLHSVTLKMEAVYSSQNIRLSPNYSVMSLQWTSKQLSLFLLALCWVFLSINKALNVISHYSIDLRIAWLFCYFNALFSKLNKFNCLFWDTVSKNLWTKPFVKIEKSGFSRKY